ncbi:MAG: DUF815 domain-containing protein [Sphingomonadaceae bacterium]|nr:DUF815 domain-containing protein [Sphingomonadaceae bacterium]
MDDALLARIADALERIAPPPTARPRDDASAYVWHGGVLRGAVFRPLPLDLLTGIDAQKAALLENMRRHALGNAAHDALLWGARGSGKSALVKAAVGAVQAEGHPLALVELAASEVATLPELFATLNAWTRPAIVFVDDLGFEGGVAPARALRSVLDGGSAARPDHIRLTVTSNRRHIVARDVAEQESAINPRDVVEDRLALADRFGLSLGFHACDQETYLAMVEGYARTFGLNFEAADAIAFAGQRGSRSGRVAWHYAVELSGREGRALTP